MTTMRSPVNRLLAAPLAPRAVVRRSFHWSRLALAAVMLVAALPRVEAAQDEQAAAIEKRLADSVRYLTSEELDGRGVGTKGLDLAAAYIAKQFEEAGLKINLFDGKPFQKFTINTATDLGPDNRLTLAGPPPRPGEKPQSIPLGVGKDFTPLAMSGSAAFDAPLVFVGYAISGKAEKYDDFQGIDVAGKVLIVLRHEPQQDDPKSVFDGTRDSPHAWINRKVANAAERGPRPSSSAPTSWRSASTWSRAAKSGSRPSIAWPQPRKS